MEYEQSTDERIWCYGGRSSTQKERDQAQSWISQLPGTEFKCLFGHTLVYKLDTDPELFCPQCHIRVLYKTDVPFPDGAFAWEEAFQEEQRIRLPDW
jgi:DNA-directed RNA polymerase subunit RPC12/RpoP